MKIQCSLKSVTLMLLAFMLNSIGFIENIEAKSSDSKAQPITPSKLINAAKRRDENIVVISEARSVSEAIEIYAPEASFIKLHFSKFRLPAGMAIKISNPEGTESYQYTGTGKGARTFNPLQGDNGSNSFSAMSINGDTVIITVEGSRNRSGRRGKIWALNQVVEIDYFMEGLPENKVDDSQSYVEKLFSIDSQAVISNPSPESTCGLDDREDVLCWDDNFPMEVDRSRPIARLLINGSKFCTAWRIGSGNYLMTNRHCLKDQETVSSTEVWFNYQSNQCDSSEITDGLVKVTGNILLKNSYDLDYTLFDVSEFELISGFGHLGIETRNGEIGDYIYIPQHGSGKPKEIAIESDMNIGGFCQIDEVDLDGYTAGTDVGYFCDTAGGSSGSPVLTADNHRVIALHHFGGCVNTGVSMSLIWPEISEFFGGVVPVGDDYEPTDNLPPQSQFSALCTDLICEFDASLSSDPDGDIVSYSWNFDDGTEATGMDVSHEFSTNGTFNVILTVQDNEGAIGQNANTVNVEMPNTNPIAGYVIDCELGVCNFDASASYDNDGSILSYSWDFGDGTQSENSNAMVSHDYTTANDYLVRLTVTDDQTATGDAESWITVAIEQLAFELTATSQKGRGRKSILLTWSGAGSSQLDVLRDGVLLTSTENDGEYTDIKLPKGKKSAWYQVCNANTQICSNKFNVKF
jgi:serine protease